VSAQASLVLLFIIEKCPLPQYTVQVISTFRETAPGESVHQRQSTDGLLLARQPDFLHLRFFCLAVMMMISLVIHADASGNNGRYNFGKSSYTVNASFTVLCPRDTALAVCYRFYHINRYLKRFNLVITPLQEGENWNKYRYVYTYIIYSCSLTIHRDLLPDSGLLRFYLQEAHSTMSFLPTVSHTGGFYLVDSIPGTDSIRLTYRQETMLTKPLNILYRTGIQFETNGFLDRLVNYLAKYGNRERPVGERQKARN
jgi:hypothetical protein